MAHLSRRWPRLARISPLVLAALAASCGDLQDPAAPTTEPESPVTRVAPVNLGLIAINAVSSGSGACRNEPAGYTALSDQPFNIVPPQAPKQDVAGWQVLTMRQRFAVQKDGSAPTGGNVIKGTFPKGHPGGTGPFRMDRPFGGAYKSVYQCFSTRISSNFTANGNSAIKFGFFITPYIGITNYVNHYINLFPKLEIRLQSGHATLNRNLVSSYSMAANRGKWVTVEVLVVGNTTGKKDGIGKMWVNGNQVLNVSNVQYFYPGQSPRFTKMTWNPTYGGGLNPVPFDLDQKIDGWYVSVK